MIRINSLGSRPGLFASLNELMGIRRAGLTALSGSEVRAESGSSLQMQSDKRN